MYQPREEKEAELPDIRDCLLAGHDEPWCFAMKE